VRGVEKQLPGKSCFQRAYLEEKLKKQLYKAGIESLPNRSIIAMANLIWWASQVHA
jgi:hypothetical protein